MLSFLCSPTLRHYTVQFCAGFMTTEELNLFESLHSNFNKYWMPLTWFSNLAARAREEGRVRDDMALRLLMDESDFLYLKLNSSNISTN